MTGRRGGARSGGAGAGAGSAMPRAALFGAGLMVLYTASIASADGITKLIGGAYAAPQLYGLSGLVVAALCLLWDRHLGPRQGVATAHPRAMALRAAATVAAALAFFQAFRLLPFAEVFLFIGMMPLLAGLMSGPILGEAVRARAWAALLAGFAGLFCLMPGGLGALAPGHLWAFAAAFCGTLSMVLARFVARRENNALALVFWPNLTLALVMLPLLPAVWRPMPLADLGWVLAYAACLFAARWLLVGALRLMRAYAATPLINLQFVWMVAIGALGFGERPDTGVWLGAAVVIGSGLYLSFEPAWAGARAPRRRARLADLRRA